MSFWQRLGRKLLRAFIARSPISPPRSMQDGTNSLLPMKKPIYKPAGRYLTTALLVYAMLEAYAAPLLSLTESEILSDAAMGAEANPASDAEVAATDVTTETAAMPIAPPESLDVVAMTPAPEPIAPPPVAPVAPPIVPPVEKLPEAIQAVPAPMSASKPDAVPPTDAAKPATNQVAPDKEPSAATPDKAPADQMVSKPDPANANRQALEQQLVSMVERDRAEKEALLRQNLIASALGYAQEGQFVLARQVAQHPTLPLAVQLELLNKIGKMEAYQAKQTGIAPEMAKADKAPGTEKASNLAKVPPTGSELPDGDPHYVPDYSVVSGSALPGGRNVPGAVLSDRCVEQNMANAQLGADLQPTIRAGVNQPTAVRPPATPTAQPAANGTGKPATTLGATPTTAAATSSQTTLTQQMAQLRSTPAPTVRSLPYAGSVSTNPVVNQSQQPIGSPPTTLPLGQTGFTLPDEMSSALQSVMGWWQPTSESRFSLGTDYPIGNGFDTTALPQVKSFSSLVLAVAWPINLQIPAQALAAKPVAKPTVPAPPQPIAAAATPTKDTTAAAKPVPTINCSIAQPGDFVLRYVSDIDASNRWDWGRFQFPLPVPTPITSAFGWRIHPITGDRRFHMGLDFGAPSGTPVLAAVTGQVVLADQMGGYGLTVVVQSEDSSERNLYAHLSGIAVQAGATVEKGTVLGWVGSTGNSTGPHLHFEAHQLTNEGWVAIDPLAAAMVEVAQGN